MCALCELDAEAKYSGDQSKYILCSYNSKMAASFLQVRKMIRNRDGFGENADTSFVDEVSHFKVKKIWVSILTRGREQQMEMSQTTFLYLSLILLKANRLRL